MAGLITHIRDRVAGREELVVHALNVVVTINPVAKWIYQFGYAAGHAAGVEIGVQAGIDETMDAYDEFLERLRARVVEVSDRQAGTQAAQELVVAPAMTQPMNLEQSAEVTTL